MILNLAWLVIASAAVVAVLRNRRDAKTVAAVLAAGALLFPIISVSDDLAADQRVADALAAVLIAIVCAIGLTAIFRITVAPQALQLLAIPSHSDPRSPPRAIPSRAAR